MALADDLKSQVVSIFDTKWERRTGNKVPEPESVTLGKDAVEIDGVVLYTDMVDSTGLVAGHPDWFAANIFKVFLNCACRVIRANDGAITSFDGDRVMAVFMGETKNTNAAKSALQITYAATQIINEEIPKKWKTDFRVRHVTGIDSGKLFVARTGIRGSNDLVWVHKSANRAARLSSLRVGGYSSIISEEVFSRLREDAKLGGSDKKPMWTAINMAGEGLLYGSTCHSKP